MSEWFNSQNKQGSENEVLFNFYNFSGSFPEEVKAFEGSLVD
jgi:hypothetical protein